MQTGIVKWFNQTKGYGFITLENSRDDAFIHITTLRKIGIDTLYTGQKVSFDTIDKHGKLAAINLQILSSS